MNRASLFVPLGIFLALCLLLGSALFFTRDREILPSALIGKPFPAFELPVLGSDGKTVTQAQIKGRITLVNVWATWCPTCKAEHGELLRISREAGLPIVGVNYKDDPAAAQRWLNSYGNPYQYNIVDQDGRLGIDLGVYGAPENFLVDADGTIVWKRVGDMNRRIWDEQLAPLLASMEDRAGGAADG